MVSSYGFWNKKKPHDRDQGQGGGLAQRQRLRLGRDEPGIGRGFVTGFDFNDVAHHQFHLPAEVLHDLGHQQAGPAVKPQFDRDSHANGRALDVVIEDFSGQLLAGVEIVAGPVESEVDRAV